MTIKALNDLTAGSLFEVLPFNIAVVDRNYNIHAANKNFAEYFGKWKGRRCHEVCKNLLKPCAHCHLHDVFVNGEMLISEEIGVGRNDNPCSYVVYFAPVFNDEGEVQFVLEISIDVANTSRYQREFNLLFENAPNFVTIIDRDFKIIRANRKFRDTFGEVIGKHCYQVYKRKKSVCRNCPAKISFSSDHEYVSTQVGVNKYGKETNYVVNTIPLKKDADGVSQVIEIASDITEITNLQDQMSLIHDYYSGMIKKSSKGIISINNDNKVQVFNPAIKELLGWKSHKKPSLTTLSEMFPENFFDQFSADRADEIVEEEIKINSYHGEEIPVRYKTFNLTSGRKVIGKAAFVEDLREEIRHEKCKIKAERQVSFEITADGVAHKMKDMLLELQSDINELKMQFKIDEANPIFKKWTQFSGKFEKASSMVSDFLNYAKPHKPYLKTIDPLAVLDIVKSNYDSLCQEKNINLIINTQVVKETPLSLKDLSYCLGELVENSIEALGKNKDKGEILLSIAEEDGVITVEVRDNGCGMSDYALSMILSTFYTTKPDKENGFGMIKVNRIVNALGGRLEIYSKENEGTIVKIILVRNRLNILYEEYQSKM